MKYALFQKTVFFTPEIHFGVIVNFFLQLLSATNRYKSALGGSFESICFFNDFWTSIVVRLREDRRTPLHSWRSQMCRELLRILAAPARILSESWRFLLQSWLQNGTAFANFNAKNFCKNHSEMPSQTIKIH